MSLSYDTNKSVIRNLVDALIAIANAEETFLNDVLYVDGDRTDDYTEDGSMAHPYKTIAAAKAASVSGDVLFVAPGTYSETVSLTAGTFLFALNMAGATITGEYVNFKGSTIEFSGNLVMENGEIIKNDTDGQIDITGALVVSSTLEVNGDITLENDETISNSVDGQLDFGAANLVTTGTLGVGGDVTLENGEKISNATDGQVDVVGNACVKPGTTGGLITKISEAAADITATATVTIQVNLPIGAKILGVQLRVDTALAGGETWDAEWNDGASLQAICTNQAVDKNTKVNKFHDDNANTPLCDAETDIVLSPNGGGSFTAQGNIRAIAYYQVFEAMGDAA